MWLKASWKINLQNEADVAQLEEKSTYINCVEDVKNFKANTNVKANQCFQLKNYYVQLLWWSALAFDSGVPSLLHHW